MIHRSAASESLVCFQFNLFTVGKFNILRGHFMCFDWLDCWVCTFHTLSHTVNASPPNGSDLVFPCYCLLIFGLRSSQTFAWWCFFCKEQSLCGVNLSLQPCFKPLWILFMLDCILKGIYTWSFQDWITIQSVK